MGGNAATQTLTVIVRGIALGELTWGNSRKALLKEAVVGIGNGVGARAGGGPGRVGRHAAIRCSGVVLGMAMVINMFVAATAGTLVPLGLRAAERRSGAGLVGVHHDDDRRVRVLLVPGAGDDVRAAT